MNIFKKITSLGIDPSYDTELKGHIELTNIFNIIFIFLILPFLFVSKNHWHVILVTVPIWFHLLSLFLISRKKHVWGRLLFSITTSTSVYFVAALLYLDDGTDGMAAKVLILGSTILPFLVFSFKEAKYIVFIVLLDFFYLLTFNHLNLHVDLAINPVSYDSPELRYTAMIVAFLMIVSVSFYVKYQLMKKDNHLIEVINELKQKNSELADSREEIAYSNEELKALHEKLTEQYKILEEQEELLKAILSSAKDGIAVIDEHARVEFWNRAAEEIFGYKFEEIKGKDVHRLFLSGNKYDEVNRKFRNIVANGLERDCFTDELSVYKKNGEKVYIELSRSEIRFRNYWKGLAIVRDVTERQKFLQQLKEQKISIEAAYRELRESLEYAKTIQKALMMPRIEIIKEFFSDNFVFFLPKDKVSGDFYYATETDEYLIIALGDATGHGVPGALLSMLSIALINNVVLRKDIFSTSSVLNLLRDEIIAVLHQQNIFAGDGLDLALCVIKKDTLELQFSGAYIPMYLIRNGEVVEFRADRMPLGKYLVEEDFKQYDFQLQKDDIIYMFTDGFVDQIGGERNKKYKRKRFIKFLLTIYQYDLYTQKLKIIEEFKAWKGDNEQIDDVTVIGLKL